MAYEKTIAAADGTLNRPQEYDTRWCYERGIITKAWIDVTNVTGIDAYTQAAKKDADQFIQEDGSIRTYKPDEYNIDMICMGRTALRLYKITGEERYLTAARHLIEQLKGHPRTPEGGLWHKKIYENQMWLDGIYMASPFMAEYAALTGETEWQQEVVRQMTLIYEKTLRPDGLHAHAWDSAKVQPWADPVTGQSPHVWSRAMGWFVMAHVDVLEAMPEGTEGREKIAAQLEKLCEAILAARGDDLMWHQVLDCPPSEENYAESSGTAMFIYSLYEAEKKLGIGHGAKAAEESLNALWNTNVVLAQDGYPELTKICKVAGLGGKQHRDGSYEYYIHETVCSGDTKGTAPFLMALTALKA